MGHTELPWSDDIFRLAPSDVLQWTEAIWPLRKRPRGKWSRASRLGEQFVIAQLLEIDKRGYLKLCVMKAGISKNVYDMPLNCHRKGDVIVRRRETLLRGKLRRLPWSEEAQRAIEVSEFLS